MSGTGRTAITPRHLFGSGLCPPSVTPPKLSALVQSEQFSLHKEQTCRFPDWAAGNSFSGVRHGRQRSQVPIISRTKTQQGPAIY